MERPVIKIQNLTKDYGQGRGVFDLNLEVQKGETYGLLGTNGAGKTTTIRQMLGFIRPDRGSVQVEGKEAFSHSPEIMQKTGYISGEIAFPPLASGEVFLKLQAEYQGIKDQNKMQDLIRALQLDPTANLKRMSKGMKQKTAIVSALMGDHEILILDEPTTGLDPLMREVFADLIRKEKAAGKTIVMSSHLFEEIEALCDKVAILESGRLLEVKDLKELKKEGNKNFVIRFQTPEEASQFAASWSGAYAPLVLERECRLTIKRTELNPLFSILKEYQIERLSEADDSLEQHYKRGVKQWRMEK